MKTLLLALTISLASTTASADFVDFTLKVSTAQAIGVTVANIINASSQATTNSKVATVQIQNDIMEYAQTGSISAFLAEKIAIVTSVDAELSEQDVIDVLIEASEIILK